MLALASDCFSVLLFFCGRRQNDLGFSKRDGSRQDARRVKFFWSFVINRQRTHTERNRKKGKIHAGEWGRTKKGVSISLSPSRSLAMFCLNIYDDENTRNQEPVLLSPSWPTFSLIPGIVLNKTDTELERFGQGIAATGGVCLWPSDLCLHTCWNVVVIEKLFSCLSCWLQLYGVNNMFCEGKNHNILL